MASRSRVGSSIVLGIMITMWFWPSSPPVDPAPGRKVQRTPIRVDPAGIFPLESSHDDDDVVQIEVLQEHIVIDLTPSEYINERFMLLELSGLGPLAGVPEIDEIPDTPLGDAFYEMMSGNVHDMDAVDQFIDELDLDPSMGGFDEHWSAVVEMEGEVISIDEEYRRRVEQEGQQLELARSLPLDEALELMNTTSAPTKSYEHLFEYTKDIIDEDPGAEVADIARLYTARAFTDLAANVQYEDLASEVLLDVVANSVNAGTTERAVRQLVTLSPGLLEEEDVELVQEMWEPELPPEIRPYLARFLLHQHFARGDIQQASEWADILELNLLGGAEHMVQEEMFAEVNEARARMGAQLDSTAMSAGEAIRQLGWACWNERDKSDVDVHEDGQSFAMEWDGTWWLRGVDMTHPICACMVSRWSEIPDPEQPIWVNVEVRIAGT